VVSGVITNAMDAMPSRVRAWIGPCIGPCHYEVGREIQEAYERAHGSQAGVFSQEGTSLRMDLPAAAALQLESSGADVMNSDPLCTYCDARFFSHRRDGGRTGRQAVIVYR
ncbi:MAG TPA: polyphenol oxidase family protein, partial [Actinomycetota bacterium]|nr:polyphenol oxidase family protein [Actinomycetota bacterium]